MTQESSVVRFAVIGLGHFAQTAILPAFQNAKDNAKLSALVTGDAQKAEELSQKYSAPAYGYEQLDELLKSGEIDAVYIAVPNSEHRKFAEQAAKAGRHVLCEKPLAYTAKDAQAMIDACERAGVKLMTAYRLHFEEGNLQAIKVAQSGHIGEPRLFSSMHCMQVDPDNIRVDRSLGGGPVEDIGIYCLNAARYVFQSEPEEVFAFSVQGTDERFQEVPEMVAASLRFPGNRLAVFQCGFGEPKISEYRVVGTEGILIMDPAFTWHGDVKQTIIVDDKEEKHSFEFRDQIAAEIVHFCECIRDDKDPEPSGREGLIDVRIIEALRKSYETKKPVKMKALPPKKKRPSKSQSIKRPPHEEPETVNVAPPSQG